MLGVRPGADPGQPQRLALVPAPSPTALAAADPAPAAPAPVAETARRAGSALRCGRRPPQPAPAPVAPPAPVAIASAAPEPSSLAATVRESQDPKPQAREVTQPLYANAVQSLVTPQPAVLRTGRAFRIPSRRLRASAQRSGARPGAGLGRYAVQLGAFSTPAARGARLVADPEALRLRGRCTPLSTTIDIRPARVRSTACRSPASTAAPTADRVCGSIRAKGGVCFVRAIAGDAPAQWATRYASRCSGRRALADCRR